MSLRAGAPGFARFLVTAILAGALTPVACGGTNSSTVGGGGGSAVAMAGAFKGKSFTVMDAASVVFPSDGNTLSRSILAIIYSDTPGICEQANTAINPNTTTFLAVLVDEASGTATPPMGTYPVADPNTTTDPAGATDAGYALILGSSHNDLFTADDGLVTVSYLDATTASGSISATLLGAVILGGKFEAPTCTALAPLVSAELGL